MLPQKVHINNYIKRKESICIDSISKIYLFFESVIGINRCVILNIKSPYVLLSFVYSLFCNGCTIYIGAFILKHKTALGLIMARIKLFQYFFCTSTAWILSKRIKCFYEEINKFDRAIGGRPKTTMCSVVIVAYMAIKSTICFCSIIYMGRAPYIPLHGVYYLELYYFGHLLSLMRPRIRLINFYLESALSPLKIASSPKGNEFIFFKKTSRFNLKMDSLLDFYQILVKSQEHLVDAIKWQVAVLLVSGFVFVLVTGYHIALYFLFNEILGASGRFTPMYVALMVTEIACLFPLCWCSDQLRYEVRRLRELLASALYNRGLDKSSRSSARALLSLTEVNNLSFSLLRMVDVSIALPFSFVGLMFTYLIILLQFQKVININN